MQDSLFQLLEKEQIRQKNGINLIASENYVSEHVRTMVGSVLMNKYAEGYPAARYYAGCKIIDEIEQETVNRFKKLFKAEHVNVQSHCGSFANFAVYAALLQPSDTILSMRLADGGHLTHGHKVNFSGSLYNIVSYGVNPETELIDYKELQRLAIEHKPKLIIAGASSYSRIIDFEKISKIAKSVEAYFLADVAHPAGLIAAGLHPSPVPFADVVTMTTQKTFRGPKGGIILCTNDLAQRIDRAVMPGLQGGAFMHEIAAKGVACAQATTSEFAAYQKQVLENAKTMVDFFNSKNYKIISGGTDTHLFVIDVRPFGLNGKEAEELLESAQIYVNRNAIPFDTLPPLKAGGIRLGTSAITTRGATHEHALEIAEIIHELLQSRHIEIANKKVEKIALAMHA